MLWKPRKIENNRTINKLRLLLLREIGSNIRLGDKNKHVTLR